MSIASDTDLWMFITSNGGLTAGRVDADGSLFPYETVDRLYDARHHTGPITLIRTGRGNDARTWQPFTDSAAEDFRLERNLYKNLLGNRIVFEEINLDLGLAFRYRWSGCDPFGLVRTAWLTRLGSTAVVVDLLDGLRNVLPYGVPLALYQQQSSLVDAYKRTECDPATGLAMFALTARITDRAEAVEELRTNVVWCSGLGRPVIALSDDAITTFRSGEVPRGEDLRTGRRGHYLAAVTLNLAAGTHATWHVVADIGLGPVEVVGLRERLRASGDLSAEIERALDEASTQLLKNVASADGLQRTGHREACWHHFASTLFNNMRGGVFADGYRIRTEDFKDFLRTRNRPAAIRHVRLLEAMPSEIHLQDLIAAAEATGDRDYERLCYEYLPLHFGRRHGDPSRPWNCFSIRLRTPDGSPALYYEGNWRDIFQNWEALAQSFPRYLPSMIAKFVNASTVDGFNPYRITRDGIDWEVVDPGNPWSHIGYWGDHQIAYLLRLLEALDRVAPESLTRMLDREIFSYASVPYRLRSYEAILADPHATVDFDGALAVVIDARTRAVGTDGKLVADANGTIRHVNLIEKLVVSALARLSNFVPDGGIWMNTQRPEWNDANNALAGKGISTVTLCYVRRYLAFLEHRLVERGATPVAVSAEVALWARAVSAILERNLPAPGCGPRSDRERRMILDALGTAFAAYRARVYAQGFSSVMAFPADELVALCRFAMQHLDHTLGFNRRPDGLFHAYHVFGPTDHDGLAIQPLHEMLEGQVAALSAGFMSAAEATRLIDRLFESRLYDAARNSFMLYPDHALPSFLEKNAIPPERANAIALLREMMSAGNTSIVAVDATGMCRFQPDLSQAKLLAARLDALGAAGTWAALVAHDRQAVLDLYEEVFHHSTFTGRSGTMYGYEGLGCIYWHMVAKLLLAVQETALRALDGGDAAAPSLVRQYDRIRAGLGFEQTVQAFGAFPTDPYSHTPRHAGAQQPGMTGQVKEEVLTRFGELGVIVRNGVASFRPRLLRSAEFLQSAERGLDVDSGGTIRQTEVPRNALAFTWCATPIVYHLSDAEAWVRAVRSDGTTVTGEGDTLDAATTGALLDRSGEITRIEAGIPRHLLAER